MRTGNRRNGWLSRPELTDAGIVLGCQTILASACNDLSNQAWCDRLVALLAAAYQGGFPRSAPLDIQKALGAWQRGDKFLAGLHLAFARLPLLHVDDACRLFMADKALEAGIAPVCLLEKIGQSDLISCFHKFYSTQPRVPAGEGTRSGQWTGSAVDDDRTGSFLSVASKRIDAICEAQYDQHLSVCRAVGLASCYAQAMARYAACLRGKQIPPFNS